MKPNNAGQSLAVHWGEETFSGGDHPIVEMGKVPEDSQYSIQVIREREGLEAIRERWNALARAQGSYGAFLCFEWFSLWLEHFLGKQELFILTVRDGNAIVCIAPCLRKARKMYGVQAWSIELIGNVYSPFRYILIDPNGETEVARLVSALVAFFEKERAYWDMVDFRSIPEEKGRFELLKAAVQDSKMPACLYTDFGDWYLDNIDFSGEEFIAGLPKAVRKDVAYCRRRLEKMGKVEIKIVQEMSCLDQFMDDYYMVYAKSWQKREKIGPSFHRDLATMAAKMGWLRLGFLIYDQDPIAAQFWITCQDTSFILKTVYDQKYRRFSPGKMLTAEMMKYAIDVDRVNEIDYGQGDEAYKKVWTPERRERKGILAFNNSITGRYLALIHNRIRPAVQGNPRLGKVLRRLRDFWAREDASMMEE